MKKEKIRKWMSENWRTAGICIAVIMIICIGMGMYIVKDTNKADAIKERAEITEIKEDNKKVSKAEKEPKAEKKEIAPDQQKDDPKKTADSVSTTQSSNKKGGEVHKSSQEEARALDSNNGTDLPDNVSGMTDLDSNDARGSVNTPASNDKADLAPPSNSNTDKPEHKNNEEVHEPKWVVDQAAWTETISEPIYEMREYSVCNTCGADITGYETPHIEEHMLKGENGSWRSEWREVQVGTNTYEVRHEEVGHWE